MMRGGLLWLVPLQLLCREWKLPGLGRRPSLLSQRGGRSQWAGCVSQREGGVSGEKGQVPLPAPEDRARTLPMWAQCLLATQTQTDTHAHMHACIPTHKHKHTELKGQNEFWPELGLSLHWLKRLVLQSRIPQPKIVTTKKGQNSTLPNLLFTPKPFTVIFH